MSLIPKFKSLNLLFVEKFTSHITQIYKAHKRASKPPTAHFIYFICEPTLCSASYKIDDDCVLFSCCLNSDVYSIYSDVFFLFIFFCFLLIFNYLKAPQFNSYIDHLKIKSNLHFFKSLQLSFFTKNNKYSLAFQLNS